MADTELVRELRDLVARFQDAEAHAGTTDWCVGFAVASREMVNQIKKLLPRQTVEDTGWKDEYAGMWAETMLYGLVLMLDEQFGDPSYIDCLFLQHFGGEDGLHADAIASSALTPRPDLGHVERPEVD